MLISKWTCCLWWLKRQWTLRSGLRRCARQWRNDDFTADLRVLINTAQLQIQPDLWCSDSTVEHSCYFLNSQISALGCWITNLWGRQWIGPTVQGRLCEAVPAGLAWLSFGHQRLRTLDNVPHTVDEALFLRWQDELIVHLEGRNKSKSSQPGPLRIL